MEPGLRDGDFILIDKWKINHRIKLPFNKWNEKTQEDNRIIIPLPQFGKYEYHRFDLVVFNRFYEQSVAPTIKRIIAMPGDTLKYKHRDIWIKNQKLPRPFEIKLNYRINFKNDSTKKALSANYPHSLCTKLSGPQFWMMNLSDKEYSQLAKEPGVKLIRPIFQLASETNDGVWPNWKRYGWNRDNMGPILVPASGDSIPITRDNILLYAEIIARYENNFISMYNNGKTAINGVEASYYRFKKDYIFVLGDNRHNALDSRHYGPIPLDCVQGVAKRRIFGTFTSENTVASFNKKRFWKALNPQK